LNLYSLVWSFLGSFFLGNIIGSTIPTANGGCIIVATDCSTSSTTFTTIVTISITALRVSILFTMLISNFIIVVIIRFFIYLVISTLYRAYRSIFIGMHVLNGSHGRVFVNTVCYFFINFIPVIHSFRLQISRNDWKVNSTMFPEESPSLPSWPSPPLPLLSSL
jgi:hypothetical protein